MPTIQSTIAVSFTGRNPTLTINPPTNTIRDVGTGDTVQVTWVPAGCTINSITFTGSGTNAPPSGATLPTANNGWELSYTAPSSAQNWPYSVSATDNQSGLTHSMDPEIDNVQP